MTTDTRHHACLRDKLGVCQWFHFRDYGAVEQTLRGMDELGCRHLRTGISWADYHRPGGKAWYDWQMKALKGVEVLLSVWHTPPSLSEDGLPSAPPKRLRDYADFIDTIITDYGDCFAALELWNEPANRLKWNFEAHDPQWRKFGEMIGMAAYWAKHRGRKTVLGGMIPVDHHWLELMREYGVLQHIDVVAIHAFPGMWWSGGGNWDWHGHWNGWAGKIGYIQPSAKTPIWVTETGLATYDLATRHEGKFDLQAQMLLDAAAAPAERIYWYSLIDLDPHRDAIEGFHVDENEYHMGLLTAAGRPKPAFWRMKELLAEPARRRSAETMIG